MDWISLKHHASNAWEKSRDVWDRAKSKTHVHFLHVGKTGGTAVKAALKRGFRGKHVRVITHKHDFSLQDVPVGDKVFFFVRDPISRFVSSFYSRQRKGQPRYYSEWSQEEREAFGTFETPEELAVAISAPDVEQREAAQKAMANISHVSDFYSKWYVNKNYLESRFSDVLIVGRQEHLSRDFAKLKNMLDLPEEFGLPESDEKAHRNPAHLDKSISKTGRRNLAEWYRQDYAFLEFCEKHSSQLRYQGF